MTSEKYIQETEDCERFAEAINTIVPIIEEYKDQKNIELEFRLGYIDSESNKFESNIHEDFFNKIVKIFQHSAAFKKVESNTIDYYNKHHQRKTVNKLDSSISLMKKTRLCNIDFNFIGTPFDVRISISKEVPIKKFIEDNKEQDQDHGSEVYSREKTRKTFVYDIFNYDMTEVNYEENSLKEKMCEIELEINTTLNKILKKESVPKFVHRSLLKLEDIAKMCEKDISDSTFRLVQIKKFD